MSPAWRQQLGPSRFRETARKCVNKSIKKVLSSHVCRCRPMSTCACQCVVRGGELLFLKLSCFKKKEKGEKRATTEPCQAPDIPLRHHSLRSTKHNKWARHKEETSQIFFFFGTQWCYNCITLNMTVLFWCKCTVHVKRLWLCFQTAWRRVAKRN